MKICRYCYGTGVKYWPLFTTGDFLVARPCEACNGSGKK